METFPKQVGGDMVQQGGELCTLILACYFSHTIQPGSTRMVPGPVSKARLTETCFPQLIVFPCPTQCPVLAWPCRNSPTPATAAYRRCGSQTQLRVLHNHPTSRKRVCRTDGKLPSPTGPPSHLHRRTLPGSSGSRPSSFHACMGSVTPRSRPESRAFDSVRVAFRIA